MSDKFRNIYRVESSRLEDWDYRWNSAYFVTICTAGRGNYFGEIKDGIMYMSDAGQIAENFWRDIPGHFPHAIIDEFVIMPNHVHGIIMIDNPEIEHIPDVEPIPSPKQGSLSTIVRSYCH